MLNISHDKCIGCENCANICPVACIEMNFEKGFLYPVVNTDKCINCDKCMKVCPVAEDNNKKDTTEQPQVYAAAAKDDKLKKESSSGGIFSLLASRIFEDNGVVYGAAYAPFTNEVIHIKAENENELKALRGSKYVQSRLNNCFEEIKQLLEENRKVMFTGTPCQNAALKKYLGIDYDNLICIQVICHGVPSPVVWNKYVSMLEDKYSSLLRCFNFRDKSTGWGKYSVSGKTSNGITFSDFGFNDPYMQLFLFNYSLRESCYKCNFKGDTYSSDITLGDFWSVGNVLPESDDNKGTSVVMINTEKGKKLFNTISEDIKHTEAPYIKAIAGNPAYIKSSYKPEKADSFKENIDKLSFTELHRKYVIFNKQHTKDYLINRLRSVVSKLRSSI